MDAFLQANNSNLAALMRSLNCAFEFGDKSFNFMLSGNNLSKWVKWYSRTNYSTFQLISKSYAGYLISSVNNFNIKVGWNSHVCYFHWCLCFFASMFVSSVFVFCTSSSFHLIYLRRNHCFGFKVLQLVFYCINL